MKGIGGDRHGRFEPTEGEGNAQRRIDQLKEENRRLRLELRLTKQPLAVRGIRPDIHARCSSGATSRRSSIVTESSARTDASSVLENAIGRAFGQSKEKERRTERETQRENEDGATEEDVNDREATATAIGRALLDPKNVHVRHEIGRGAFGVVYMLHVNTQRGRVRCAQKVIRHDGNHANREADHVRFLMQHPHVNIVPFYSCKHVTHPKSHGAHDDAHHDAHHGAHDDETLLVHIHMQYVPYTLKHLLGNMWNRRMHMRTDVHVGLMAQLANALVYIHEHHICHRDLKPDNVLVDIDAMRLYLADFGCAKVILPHSRTKSETYMCSRFYRAPELVIDRNLYGSGVDVWAYGCVFVECCIGRVLFAAKDNVALLVAHIRLLGEITVANVRAMRTEGTCEFEENKNTPFLALANRSPRWAKLFARRTFGPAFEVLCPRMLTFNVANRATARQLLASDYLRHYALPAA